MKRLFILFCVAALFITCKKEQKNPPPNSPQPEIVGTWTLYSSTQSSTSATANYSVTQYPCMGENVLKINADHTTLLTYTGSDTCYVTPQHFGVSGATYIGYPGQPPFSGTWASNGSIYKTGNNYSRITSQNGKLFLTIIDTLATSPALVTITNTDIKQ
jgi:hypothetical protein